MQSVGQLKELLQTQFGPFIRDDRYKQAFDRALESMDRLDSTPKRVDVFYMFMHHLIIELFAEIDKLSNQLNTGNKGAISTS